ncbi:hypothetical protein MMC09_004440 [Bachmanniomyces sp. S44760]|nr:hypothetical protein [Bachmanniomyces sp. S44760]
MASVYKVAVIQLHPKPLQIEANFQKAASFIETAASKGAQLAVLPEYHLTNWVPDDPQWSSLCGQWKIYLDKYCALAKAQNICIVPGTIVELHQDAASDEEKFVNVAYFIDNEGQILGSYQKKNLWHPERAHLTSSTHDPHDVIQTPFGPIGLLICWDLAFPEAFRELISHGAKIIIIPTFWTLTDCSPYGLSLNPRSEALFLTSTLTARCFANTCAIIFSNAGGPSPDPTLNSPSKPNAYAGLSQVTVPFVGALGDETKDSGYESMSVVDLDMQIVEEAEKQYKIREDIAREDWHYFYRHTYNDSGKRDGDDNEEAGGEVVASRERGWKSDWEKDRAKGRL